MVVAGRYYALWGISFSMLKIKLIIIIVTMDFSMENYNYNIKLLLLNQNSVVIQADINRIQKVMSMMHL